MNAAETLRDKTKQGVLANSASLSTRQVLRIAQRFEAYEENDVAAAVKQACLARFLPSIAAETLEKLLVAADAAGSTSGNVDAAAAPLTLKIVQDAVSKRDVLEIGSVRTPVKQGTNQLLVPKVVFFDNPTHLRVMQDMLKDFALGEHLLLVGNQGVGKNKIADRLLQLLNYPREYMQLHRDTTVQNLTIQPSIKNGQIVYDDSALVRAVVHGSVLVVDEADKAPTHVTCVLKTLVENGEMNLADGRRIIPHDSPMYNPVWLEAGHFPP